MIATVSNSTSIRDIVYLVDDDDSMRESLTYMLTKAGFEVRPFSSPQNFLDQVSLTDRGCVVLDFKMPEVTGLELVSLLRERESSLPFLVLTGFGTISVAVEAMRLGASDFIEKPVEHTRLIECIRKSMQAKPHESRSEPQAIQIDSLGDILTDREQQILEMVVDGFLTKQIANHLCISTKTVDVHRSHIMKKLNVSSVAQLVRKVIKA